MKNLLKLLVGSLLFVPLTLFAITVPWNKVNTGKIYPPIITDFVGIGTNNAQGNLHIIGNADISNLQIIESTSASDSGILYSTSNGPLWKAGANIGGVGADVFNIYNFVTESTANAFSIDVNNRINVNRTGTPSAQLHVLGDGSRPAGFFDSNSNSTVTLADTEIGLISSANGYNAFLSGSSNAAAFTQDGATTRGLYVLDSHNEVSVQGRVAIGSDSTYYFATAPVDGLMVQGRVGIGTTSPYSKLSVVGTTTAAVFEATTTATSTFAGGIRTNLVNVTSTTASSTFANGINLTKGCFAFNNTCLAVGVSSVSNSDSTLTISPTTGAVVASLNLSHANTWGALQNFNAGAKLNSNQTLTSDANYVKYTGRGLVWNDYCSGQCIIDYDAAPATGAAGISFNVPTDNKVAFQGYGQVDMNNVDFLALTTYFSGNVGVRTAAPVRDLNVNGKALFGTDVDLQPGGSSHTVDIAAGGTDSPLMLEGGSGVMEFWQDTTPSKAVSFGMAVPGTSITDNLVLSTWDGSFWNGRMTILTANGNVGIGTTTPYATLAIQSNASTGDAFVVATTTKAAIAGYDNDGHRFTSGPAPAISSCGTGTGTVVGDDQSGTITTATAATACTMTFSKAYRKTPTCTVSDDSTVGFPDVSAISTTAATFGISSALTGGKLYYSCSYHQ